MSVGLTVAVLCLIFFHTVYTLQTSDDCVTPNGERAKCVSIYSCPVLINALKSPQSDSKEFVQKSICDVVNQTVCCGSSSSFVRPPQLVSFEKLVATSKFCGRQHSDDYFHTLNATIINEFPWLAVFAYVNRRDGRSRPRRRFKCSGSLINNRYVLTAAQCVTDNQYKVALIRLGEYHINNDTDCIEDMDLYECSDPIQDFGIEKIIVHEKHDRLKATNDIALIRLNKTVYYSDYIRPICLPLPNVTAASLEDVLVTSGWGIEITRSDDVDIKTKSYHRMITADDCERLYATRRKQSNVEIHENRFCTLYLSNNTEILCNGDGGGPVMLSRRNLWYQEGIISAGPPRCDLNTPLIHTKVAHFLKWIEDRIEP